MTVGITGSRSMNEILPSEVMRACIRESKINLAGGLYDYKKECERLCD